MAQTLYNPTTGITATPTAGVTADQTNNAVGMGFNQTTPPNTFTTPQVITPSALAPAIAYNLPQPAINTTAQAISGATDASVAQTDQQRALDAKVATDTQAKSQSKNDLQSLQDQILGVQSSRATNEAAVGIPEKNVMANDAYTALQASKRAQEKALLAAQSSTNNPEAIGLAQSEINRKYAFEQADLSIALDVANRNLSAAQTTADRKIQLQLEPLQTKLDFQKTFYQENKDQLTKDEDKQYQSLLTKSQREYDTTKTNSSSISDWIQKAIQYGHPELIQAFSKLDPTSKTFNADLATVASRVKAVGADGNYVAGANPVADSHITNILNGNETMQQVPANLRNIVSVGLTQQPSAAYSPVAASRFSTAANRIVQNYIKLPQFQLTANGLPYIQRIQAADSIPGSVSDAELLDSIVKLNTGGNQVTEAQVRLITGGQSYSDSLNVWKNKLNNGGVLSDSQRTQLTSLANKVFDRYKADYQPVYEQATKQLKAAGIPEAFWTIPNLNKLGAESLNAGDATSTAIQPKEGETHDYNGVSYVVKDGQWVIK